MVRVAQAEVQRMRAATLGQPAEKRIELPIEDFRRLADLVEQVCDLVKEPDGPSLGYSRYFVPIDLFRDARTRALELEDECRRLRAAASRQMSIAVQPQDHSTYEFSPTRSAAPVVNSRMSFAYGAVRATAP